MLTDTEIIKAISCAHDKFILGTRAGKSSRFAVLDIDANSKFHDQKHLQRLLKVLQQAGLSKSSLFRSSYSEGWHLYLFFDEAIDSRDLHRQLVALLTLSDFQVAKGMLEVFPNPGRNSLGMGLRLPLQPGFAWLNKHDLSVDFYREEMTATKALTYFLDLLENDCNTFSDFRRLKSCVEELEARQDRAKSLAASSNVVPFRRPEQPQDMLGAEFARSIFSQVPPGMNTEDWSKGRQFAIDGLSGPSQRAEAIFCLGHYLFYGDPSREVPALGYGYEEERSWAIREFLETRNNGQSKDITRGRADALEQVSRAANWRPEYKRQGEPTRYVATTPVAWVRGNAKRKNDARERITGALEQLRKLGRSFTTVELQESAECSRATLYKHADIWRQDYEDLAAGFFETCTGEYNAVGGASSQESKPPAAAAQKITPPGLLAARRVVYEISMRSKRDIRRRLRVNEAEQDSSEKVWRDKIASLTKEEPALIPTGSLKALLFVLGESLRIAPCEESATGLAHYIQALRVEFASRQAGPEKPS